MNFNKHTYKLNYVFDSRVLVESEDQLLSLDRDGGGEALSISISDLLNGGNGTGSANYVGPNGPYDLLVDTHLEGASFYVNDHLGNTRIVFNRNTCSDPDFPFYVESAMDYYPFGKILREYHAGQKEKYLTTQHERDGETGFDYRGARIYDSDLGRFLSLDPAAMEYPTFSDYVYVLDNPIIFIDPDGKNAAPIYNMDGEYMGTDSEGSDGDAILMDESDFEQGMEHSEALEKGTLLSDACSSDCISTEVYDKVNEHYNTRPKIYASIPENYLKFSTKDIVDLVDGTSFMRYDNKWISIESQEEYEKRVEWENNLEHRRSESHVSRSNKAIRNYDHTKAMKSMVPGGSKGGTASWIYSGFKNVNGAAVFGGIFLGMYSSYADTQDNNREQNEKANIINEDMQEK